MATALRSFRKVQIGKESTKGNAVAATKVMVGNGFLSEQQDFYRSAYARGQRFPTGGAGVVTRKGAILAWETELTAEEILWPLSTGVQGNVSPNNTNSEYTWTFTPQNSGVPTLDAATLEFMESDGVTNHIARKSAYAMTRSFEITWAADGKPAQCKWEMFARASATATPTAALSAYSGREPLVGDLCTIYLDTTWAGLGGTQLTALVRSGSLKVMCGVEPDYTCDGRADHDFTNHKITVLSASLNLVLEMDATGAARYDDYRTNDLVYIRLKFAGSTVVANARSVQVDGGYRFVGEPARSEDGEQVLVGLSLEAHSDETNATKFMGFVVVNGQATL